MRKACNDGSGVGIKESEKGRDEERRKNNE
jgi:hypothetical protein